MSRSGSHRSHHVRRQVKKQVLFLSRTTLDIWHYCRARATEAIQDGKRFSLMSPADYQTTFAAQHIRNLNRLSAQSDQIVGFHVVCAECEGFVVRDGVVRNCEHQRGSWCSAFSNKNKDGGREVGRRPSGQRMSDVRISVQPPTPVASPEPDTRGEDDGAAGFDSTDTESVEERRLVQAKVLQPVPTILRPGHSRDEIGVTRTRSEKTKARERIPTILRPGRVAEDRGTETKEFNRKAVGSGTSFPSKQSRRSSGTANVGADASLQARNAVRKTHPRHQRTTGVKCGSVDSKSTDQPLINPDALMQNWQNWSEGWESSVTRVNSRENKSRSIDRPHYDPDALMQEWREWSVRWERSVRSR